MLAGAVVLQRCKSHAGRRQLFADGVEERRMNAALQIFRRATRALEHVGHGVDMTRLAGVTRTQECHLRLAVSEALDATAGDKRQRLQRLERASRRRKVVWIASPKEQPPVAIDYRDGSVVHTVGGVAPGDEGKRNVRRSRGGNGRQRTEKRRKRVFYRESPPANACRICSSAPGSSIVVRSPGSRPSARAWIERRNSFPERVFGNIVTKCTAPGRAIAPSSRSTVSITSRRTWASPSADATRAGSLTTAKATGICPLIGSATPTTATSAIPECACTASSISRVPMRCPATLMTSSVRPSTK